MYFSLQFRETTNQSEFESLLRYGDYPFTQSFAFGLWQQAAGHIVTRYIVIADGAVVSAFQVIRYQFPFPFNKSFLYIPHGPVVSPHVPSSFGMVWHEFAQNLLRGELAMFLRFDISLHHHRLDDIQKHLRPIPRNAYRAAHLQPRYEWVVEIADRSERELIAAMHPKMRYNIGLAEQKGVKVEIVKDKLRVYNKDFYALLRQTARHHGFRLHPHVYYDQILETADTMRNGFLAAARWEGKIIAVNFINIFGETATYVFGGSDYAYRNLMAPALLHKISMLAAQQHGCSIYDLGGVDQAGETHPDWAGLTRFKRQFGGTLLDHGQPYDIVGQPFWYTLYNLRQSIRNSF